MIIFLDFDGVLHPFPLRGGELFSAISVFWKLLNRLPDAQVVISSSWRERYELDVLKDMLTDGGGERFRERIIGTTPVLGDSWVFAEEPDGIRQKEVERWLDENGQRNTQYLILDDIEKFFDGTHLYLTDATTGLVERDVQGVIDCILTTKGKK